MSLQKHQLRKVMEVVSPEAHLLNGSGLRGEPEDYELPVLAGSLRESGKRGATLEQPLVMEERRKEKH